MVLLKVSARRQNERPVGPYSKQFDSVDESSAFYRMS